MEKNPDDETPDAAGGPPRPETKAGGPRLRPPFASGEAPPSPAASDGLPGDDDFPFTAQEEARTVFRGQIDDAFFTKDPAPDPDPDIGALAAAAGKAVELDSLLAGAGGVDLLESLAETLRRALDDPAAQDMDGVRLITPLAFLAAALEEWSTKNPELDRATVHEAAFAWALERPEGVADDPAIRRDQTRPAPERAALSPALSELMVEAARIARRTQGGRLRIDARHLLTALAGSPSGAQALADLGLLRPDPAARLASFRDMLASHILAQRSEAGLSPVWQAIFDAIDPEALAATLRPAAPAPAPLPEFRSDDVSRARAAGGPGWLASDRLGAAADARAFADLICLEEARPPLAIGLFGAWGSGKSTFMRMIEEGVEDNRAVAARLAEQGTRPPFVRNVVHVWFNAWHYLDANLWASLVSHIFRELDRQSRESPRDFLQETQVDALIRKLATAEAVEAGAAQDVDARRRQVEAARDRLAALEGERAALLTRLSRAAPDMLDPARRARLDAALTGIGVKDARAALGDLGRLAAEGRSLGGRLALVLGSLTSGARAVWSPAVGLVLLGLGLAGAAWFSDPRIPPALRDLGGTVAAGLGAVTGALAWLGPHLARVNAALKPVFEAEAAAEAERAAARAELARLEAEQTRRERELAEAREDLAGLRALARGERPGELLAHFIEDRAGGEGYRRHLGLLSRIRDDFELMSELMRRGRDGGGEAELPGIERIVLYIDDLDRCRDEQVVEVLEAIHLLLAFDLFVVVVGVDSRWIEGALGRFYRRQLARGGKGAAAGPSGDDRPSVADYLEKIFQAPFRLRPLDFAAGGGYARLVDDLVGDLAPEAGDDEAAPAPEAPGREAEPPVDLSGASGLILLDLDVPAPPETAADLYARLRLTRAEREAIEALGPIVGASPRKAKRFVNLYRLMRVRRRGEALKAFLEEAPLRPAPFRMALLWLAVETGLGTDVARRFADALRADGAWGPAGVAAGLRADDLRMAPPPDVGFGVHDGFAHDRARHAFWESVASHRVRATLVARLDELGGLGKAEVYVVVAEAERFSLRAGEDLFEAQGEG